MLSFYVVQKSHRKIISFIDTLPPKQYISYANKELKIQISTILYNFMNYMCY